MGLRLILGGAPSVTSFSQHVSDALMSSALGVVTLNEIWPILMLV